MRNLILVYNLVFLAYIKMFKGDDVYFDSLIKFVKKQGGLYVKFVQVLAMQTGIFPKDKAVNLVNFYDDVGIEDLDVEAILRKELGPNVFDQITALAPTPFASGAFAQVYKATLSDGTAVIVKVKKPGLSKKLFFDFLLLKSFILALDAIYSIPLLDPGRLYGEFRMNIYRELDYKREVQNALFWYDCYKDHPYVKVPKTYEHLCGKNIIVQEYVEGLPLTKLIRAKYENEAEYQQFINRYSLDIYNLMRNIGYELAVQGPKFEKFFGDPHPGNIILLSGARFAFIDFGILDDVRIDRKNFYAIMGAVVNMQPGDNFNQLSVEMLKFGALDLYHALEVLDKSIFATKLGVSFVDLVASNYSKVINEKTDNFISKKEAIGGFTEIFYDIVKLGNKYNLRVPEYLFNVMRSSAIFGSYARFFMPDVDVMPSVYVQILKEQDSFAFNAKLDAQNPFQADEAAEYIMDWVTGIAEKDMRLFLEITNLLKDIKYV